MILNNSNWQPSITRSVRGNSSYKFQNQVFGSDVDKLKVEIALAGKPLNQIQILPCTLTVSYIENIDDEVFSIPLGLTKLLATLISNLKPYPFRITLENPNATAVIGTVKKPIVRRILTSPDTNPMPIHQPSSQNNADIIAAIRDQSAAQMNDTSLLARAIADADLPENTYRVETRYNATIAPQEIVSLNPLRRSLMISTTCANHVYRFYSQSTPFTDLTYTVELVGANAQWELPEEMCQQPIWMACDTDGAGGTVDQPVDVLVTEILVVSPQPQS